VPEWSIGAHC